MGGIDARVPSLAITVGHKEEPPPEVRRSDLGRAEHSPLRIEPEAGQGCENVSEPSNNDAWHVFQEDETGSNLAKYARDVGPQPALVLEAATLAGWAEGLTRESRSNAIHDATPRLTIEGGDVRPDRSRSHGTRLHRRDQVCCGEGFPLHVTDAARADASELKSKLESSVSGT